MEKQELIKHGQAELDKALASLAKAKKSGDEWWIALELDNAKFWNRFICEIMRTEGN